MGNELLQHMQTANVQRSLPFCTVSPEPILFAHVSGRPRVNSSKGARHVHRKNNYTRRFFLATWLKSSIFSSIQYVYICVIYR